ncbi:MAG: KAP family NTPase, partial [Gemmatimonadota bacterium]|nr:KAP family NTPase [Gemmatimonadota bacterium]
VALMSEVAGGSRDALPGVQTALDVRHVIAAYVYAPAGHESELDATKIDRGAWSNAFIAHIDATHPHESVRWRAVHRRVFPILPVAPHNPLGPSTRIATDKWTTEDALGYRSYAYAIARFMRHKDTNPPLTISIQAPWGGGKTSLMRMIQEELDPGEVHKADARSAPAATPATPRGEKRLTVQGALDELRTYFKDGAPKQLPNVPSDSDRQLLTIWFNAWKYDSVNQVWAGLIDAIMHQIAGRLTPFERERFWLRLNLKRVDAERIREKLYERIFHHAWRHAAGWLAAGGAALVLSGIAALFGMGGVAPIGTMVSAALVAVGGVRAALASIKAKTEPAAPVLGDYLDLPNYAGEVGLIHKLERDLHRVLESVPTTYWPIVVFIDDLDRCSPTKVAQVVEALNLFLGGQFPNCMFVIGMDTEMVAAALQSAHKEMIDCLPSDAGIPIGWRFMDKFVQLPFLIPPIEATSLDRYTDSLFGGRPTGQAATLGATHQLGDPLAPKPVVDEKNKIGNPLLGLAGPSDESLENQPIAELARPYKEVIDQGIAQFTDDNEEVRQMIGRAASYFRGNPRELKRFVNLFRFEYFLWWARRSQQLDAPTLDQLLKWTVLSMKWPELVRWLRRGNGAVWTHAGGDFGSDKVPMLSARIRLLESLSLTSGDGAAWQAALRQQFGLDPATTSWFGDSDLYRFLRPRPWDPDSGSLADGVGKGLW